MRSLAIDTRRRNMAFWPSRRRRLWLLLLLLRYPSGESRPPVRRRRRRAHLVADAFRILTPNISRGAVVLGRRNGGRQASVYPIPRAVFSLVLLLLVMLLLLEAIRCPVVIVAQNLTSRASMHQLLRCS